MGISGIPLQRTVNVVDAALSPEALGRKLALTAKAELSKAITSGDASDSYTRIVNGVAGVVEESVTVPGYIRYSFNYLEEIAFYVLAFLRARYSKTGPARGGHYRDSHFVMVNGQVWDNVTPVPPTAEMIVTNDQPYARKVHIGAKGFELSRGIYDDARKSAQRRYKEYDMNVTFVSLNGAYLLRTPASRKAKRQAALGRGFERSELRYPALVIRRGLAG